ncbi:hypothetical protein AGABI2DRAFT_222406, partial [Agaricus bisporus var. bisporus H97]|uniref:hypothetical protein n=1 Tax=Agaricus bisporus var. bisporus (strain H97 / ATCC MYA-4626 / FGSC 10389) TaxID=936046 RepID=UPI00029F535A
VVPTLVYQLAIKIPQYRSLIASELADNPLLLRNSPHLQFKKLIIEPFTILHRQHPRKPIVIVLDGLDECDREEAQLTILALINDALHASPDLPILWLICSRPEQHFKHAFFTFKHCGRLELVIDEESHKDVELYVRTRITRIQGIFKEFTPSDWPSENKLKELLDKISGLFVLAATCLDFVGDTNTCDPVGQLDYLL